MRETLMTMPDGSQYTPEDLRNGAGAQEKKEPVHPHRGRVHRAHRRHNGAEVTPKVPPSAPTEAAPPLTLDASITDVLTTTGEAAKLGIGRSEQDLQQIAEAVAKIGANVAAVTEVSTAPGAPAPTPAERAQAVAAAMTGIPTEKGAISPEEQAQAFFQNLTAEAAKRQGVTAVVYPETAENPVPGDSEPTPSPSTADSETLFNFDQMLKDGGFDRWKVAEVTERNGRRAVWLEDPITKERIFIDDSGRKPKEMQMAGLIPEPNPATVNTEAGARAWLERYLRNFEGQAGVNGIDPQLEQSIMSTLSGFPETAAFTVEQKNTLLILARARIHYHNADNAAGYSLDTFAESVGKIYAEEHAAIYETPGVQEALNQFTQNDGEVFRLNPVRPAPNVWSEVEARQDVIRQGIATSLGLAIPPIVGATATNPGRRNWDDNVELAFELGQKTLNMFGYSAEAEGVRLTDGTVRTFMNPVGNSRAGDGTLLATSAENKWQFMIDNWDQIQFNNVETAGVITQVGSLRGPAPRDLRRAMYYQVHLNRADTTDPPGRQASLRRYADLWVSSAQNFEYNQRDAGTPNFARDASIMDTLQAARTPGNRKLATWATVVAHAWKEKEQFAAKGGESFLTAPIVKPNDVSNDNFREKMPEALGNVAKVGGSVYALLDGERKHLVMSEMTKAAIDWVNSPEARARDILGWNDFVREKAILQGMEIGIYNDGAKRRLLREMYPFWSVQHWHGMFDDAGKEFFKGFGGALKNMWRGVTRVVG